jgi:hypothetical protein
MDKTEDMLGHQACCGRWEMGAVGWFCVVRHSTFGYELI